MNLMHVGSFETSGAPERLKHNLNVAQNRKRNDLKMNVKVWVLMGMKSEKGRRRSVWWCSEREV